MDFHPELLRQLDLLSETLDDGTDLHAVLAVLADDLLAVIPTFVGLDLHLHVAGIPVLLSTLTADADAPARTSLLLPLGDMGMTLAPCTLVCYASEQGAFADLATDVRTGYRRDHDVVLDTHLPPRTGPPAGVIGLGELGTVNQAVGMLVGRDLLTIDQALAALHHLARQGSRTLLDAARDLVRGPPAR